MGVRAHGEPAVSFVDVVQRFGRKTPLGDTRKTVLDGITLTVRRGTILCLLGPSGCGKTTMVDLIVGNTVPVSGEVRVFGELAPYLEARLRIGYMPQDEALYDDITGEENMRFFGSMFGLAGAELSRRIEAMLDFGNLRGHKDKLVGAYSGGMKRRLSLGIALLHEPDLLVLDEPTVGLDPDHRRRIWDAFSSMAAAGTTILVTTHVMDEAQRCDEIAMLHQGRIIADDSPDAIMSQTKAETLEEAFLALEARAEAAREEEGVRADGRKDRSACDKEGRHA